MPDLSRRAKQEFLDLVERSPSEQAVRLDELDREEPDLAERVRGLLQASDDVDTLFEASVPARLSAADLELQPGSSVDEYEILAKIGEGGFAIVYRARQTAPVVRDVALKVLKAGMDSAQVIARFEAERQALAVMDHPSIATVFDGGVTGAARPWFAMELVDGEPITDYCERRSLSIPDRLRLVLRVCRAVQHAHQKSIVHRDLKPANVLVTEVDGEPVPKVIDFGIAKALERPLTDATLKTHAGQFIGTPSTMAPEQFGGAEDVDTRADVYALGCVLYELLTDSRPIDDSTVEGLEFDELLRALREVEPPSPSVRVRSTTGGRSRAAQIRGDLDWVTKRCLEKDRERRYDSVAVLGNEIERVLAGQPVLAGPPDFSYRAAKFVRRNRIALAVCSSIFAILVVGVVVSTDQLLRAREAERGLAEQVRQRDIALDRERATSQFWEAMWLGIQPESAKTEDTSLLRRLLVEADERAATTRFDDPQVEAVVRRVIGNAFLAIGRLEAAERQFRTTVALRQAALEPLDAELLLSMHELGTLLGEMGRFDEADPLLRKALDGRRETLGADHEDTLRTAESLGSVLRQLGRLEEAKALSIEVLGQIQRGAVPRPAAEIRALNNLAVLLSDLDEKAAALSMLEEAAAAQERLSGPEHLDTLRAWNNLGEQLAEQGRVDEAIRYLRRALDGKLAVLTDGHPSLLIAYNNLAERCRSLGRPEEALRLYEAALESAERGSTTRSQRAVILRRNYAILLDSLERFDDADAQLERSAVIARDTLGPESRITIQIDSDLGWQRVKHGDASQALELLRSSVDRARERFPEGAPQQFIFGIRLGVGLHRAGLDDNARPLLERHLKDARAAGIEVWVDQAESALAEMDR